MKNEEKQKNNSLCKQNRPLQWKQNTSEMSVCVKLAVSMEKYAVNEINYRDFA